MIKLYNTLTRQKEELSTIEKGIVKVYVCGLTVYAEPHIGNWVSYINWDVLVRNLKANGYKVEHVQNITDVGHLTDDEDAGEDKMQKAARQARKTAWDVAKHFTERAEVGRGLLNILEPGHSPKATELIDEQIDFVKQLEAKGFTYEIKGDGLYFDSTKDPEYGKLARLDVEGLEAGARVKDVGKKHHTDFAVWKFSLPGEKRDMEWDSPWGKGYPGWHLECSVMSRKILGDKIDIHTGGIDHINVHHTNEIAQTKALTGEIFASIWLHANHMKVDSTKMSKSLGNVYTLDDLKNKGFDPMVFRLFVLQSHYRTESNFTFKQMESVQQRLNRWQAMAALVWQPNDSPDQSKELAEALERAVDALNDDLNTPIALKEVESGFSSVETSGLSIESVDKFNELLDFVENRLGIVVRDADIDSATKKLIDQREAARHSKDFKTADQLRDQLADMNIGLRDTPSGAVWFRKQ
ncbi:MAG: cysteine--tRNA ligase [Candidatus Saccharimonadales bacterium]|nr:cysteine--tRNA ligase [Candidatus Saccharimonadales bacterium]